MKYALLYLGLLMLAHTHCLARNEAFENSVLTEFQRLQRMSGETSVKLTFDYSKKGSAEAKPAKGLIVFNVPQFEDMVSNTGAQYHYDIIRLIIAHELGHQIQYRQMQTPSGGLVSECQADILAGYLIYLVSMGEMGEWQKKNGIHDWTNVDYKAMMSTWDQRFKIILNSIFNKGTKFVLAPSHPSNLQRCYALKDGYNYGYLWLYNDFSKSDPVLVKTFNHQHGDKEAIKYKKLLNFLEGDNLITWSYRRSRKIVHDYLPNCKNIVAYTNWRWDSSVLMPSAKYSHQITNVGRDKLTLSFCDQIFGAKKSEPDNQILWDLIATQTTTITLSPGESKAIDGKLEFSTLGDFIPKYVSLASKEALFTCTTLHDPYDASKHYPTALASNQVRMSDNIALDALISMRDTLGAFVGGLGDVDSRTRIEEVFYNSTLEIPSAISTKITYNKGARRFNSSILYYHGYSSAAAQKSIETITQTLSSLNVRFLSAPALSTTLLSKIPMRDFQGTEIGDISISYSPSFRQYDVYLNIYGR